MTHPHLEGLIRKWRERAEKAGLDARDNDSEGNPSDWEWAACHYLNKCAGELSAALAALPGGGVEWIAVSDRLPESSCHILVACTTGHVTQTFYSTDPSWFDSHDTHGTRCPRKTHGKYSKHFENARKYGYIISHWMPLPLSPTPNPHEADRNG